MARTSIPYARTARARPEELRLWIAARSRQLPKPISDLPHLAMPMIDLQDADAKASLRAFRRDWRRFEKRMRPRKLTRTLH